MARSVSEKRKKKATLWTARNKDRVVSRKDRNVARSSHGKFSSVKSLEDHRKMLCGVV